MSGSAHRPTYRQKGLHMVALFEAAKGALVLLTGCGILLLIHTNLHLAAEELVREIHLNPSSHYPRIFIDAASHLTNTRLWALAVSALCYATIRFVEAVALWRARVWAEWFGLLSGAVYLPVELFEVSRRVTWPRLTVLTVNLIIVAYLGSLLYAERQRKG